MTSRGGPHLRTRACGPSRGGGTTRRLHSWSSCECESRGPLSGGGGWVEMCASAWNCTPEVFMENDVGQTLKNATSEQRSIISYALRRTKEEEDAGLFHNDWCNSLPSAKILTKPCRRGHPIVLVSASIRRDFPDASRASADRPKHRRHVVPMLFPASEKCSRAFLSSSGERNLGISLLPRLDGPASAQARN